MGEVKVRSSFTSRGWISFGPWTQEKYSYALAQINVGSNPNSLLEIVSAPNITNYGTNSFWYDSPGAPKKYNPKVYLSAVQSVADQWNFDRDYSRENLAQGDQKSGSCP